MSRGSLLKFNDFNRITPHKEYKSEMQERDINISPNSAVITESESMIIKGEETKKGGGGGDSRAKKSFPQDHASPKFAK
jgi:hypothetical protein